MVLEFNLSVSVIMFTFQFEITLNTFHQDNTVYVSLFFSLSHTDKLAYSITASVGEITL